MRFNSEKHEKFYNRIKCEALRNGFTQEELERCDLSRLNRQTKSKRILHMIRLAYYLGQLRGIKDCDEVFYSVIRLSENDVNHTEDEV